MPVALMAPSLYLGEHSKCAGCKAESFNCRNDLSSDLCLSVTSR